MPDLLPPLARALAEDANVSDELRGAGIAFGMEESFRALIARGELMPILEEYCPSFAGFYLYYPSRRNIAPKLRVLIDYLQRQR